MTPGSERPYAGPAPDRPPRRSSRRERIFVLAGIALAVPATAVIPVLDIDRAAIGLVWLVAIAWTALAGLAAALRCGIVEGDWSAFGGCRCRGDWPSDSRAERFDWDTRTGRYAWMRIEEDRQRLLEDDRLHSRHGI